jgi:hypothetical protein
MGRFMEARKVGRDDDDHFVPGVDLGVYREMGGGGLLTRSHRLHLNCEFAFG